MKNNETISTEEKKNLSEKVSAFLSKYRVIIVGFVVVLLVCAVLLSVVLFVSDNKTDKGFAELDKITFTYSEMIKDATAENKIQIEDEAITDALALAEKNKSNAVGMRSFIFAADVLFNKANFEDAAKNYEKASAIKSKSYLAGIALYNAAICYDELNNYDAAIENLNKAVKVPSFIMKNKAMFQKGRVLESKGDFDTAYTTYSELFDLNPADPWAILGKSRMIALAAEGKVQF